MENSICMPVDEQHRNNPSVCYMSLYAIFTGIIWQMKLYSFVPGTKNQIGL